MNHKATTVGANSTNRVRLSCMRSVRGWTAFRRLQPDVFRRCALVEKRPIQLAAKSSNIRCCVYIVRFEDQRIDKIFLHNMPPLLPGMQLVGRTTKAKKYGFELNKLAISDEREGNEIYTKLMDGRRIFTKFSI